MATSETIKIADQSFTAVPLTVKQIREVIEWREADSPFSVIDLLFKDGLPSKAMLMSLSVTEEEIEEFLPEQVQELMEAVAKANPTYADMEKRMSAMLATASQ